MKLTQKLEKEILKVYHDYWDAYLRGDMKAFASMLDDNITIFGTAVSEVFNNKKETVSFYKATADQMTGKADFRNRQIRVQSVDNTIVINEQNDLYVLIDEKWTFYGHARVTAIFQQTEGEWKLVHQHASFPDNRAEEGEQIAAKKIKAENLELRDAIKRRTVELETKNRELEIETALERVRTVAMGMKKPDDLMEICKAVYTELQALGFSELRNTLIDIFVDEENYFIDYDYSEFTGGSSSKIPYSGNPVIEKYIKDIRKSGEAFSEITVKGKQLEAWKKFRRDNGEIEDSRLNDLKALYYYKYSIGPGGIGISTYSRISKEKLNILHRFRNVFNLSYQRYTDIAQAEAQAKEAKIELALERVRARAMAMQNSNELAELVSVLFKELTQLDFSLTSCIIWLHDHEQTTNTLWIASTEMNKPAQPFQVQPFYLPFFKSIIQAWKAKDSKWIYSLAGSEKKTFENAFFKELPNLPDAFIKALKMPKQVVFSASFNNFGALEIVETETLTDEKFDILHRFGKVFDSSYTRFNDLKKAEAQAREAKIEVALEKVRSRTMGMQQSHELGDVATVLFKELNQLVANLWTCGFVLCEKDRGEDEWWLSTGDGFIPAFYLPNTVDPTHANIYDAWKKGETYHTEQLEGEALQEHYDWLMNIPVSKNIFDEIKAAGNSLPTWQKLHCAYFSYGYLVMITQVLCPEEQIFKRFAQVFDQTYTRFLDLQKAEAQAREAQIQLSLERVRARAMAMHNSDELGKAAILLYRELQSLGITQFINCGYVLIDEINNTQYAWMTHADGTIRESHQMPLTGDSVMDIRYDRWKRKDPVFHQIVGGEKLKNHLIFVSGKTDTAEGTDNVIPQLPDPTVFYCGNFSEGYLHILADKELSKESEIILSRFTTVFEITYRRFRDLQKAEAQAREAQIEASLERIRSHAMAMRDSGDLSVAAGIVFSELKKLGIHPFRSGVGLLTEEPCKALLYAAMEGPDYDALVLVGPIDLSAHKCMAQQYESCIKQENYFPVLTGKEFQSYIAALADQIPIPSLAESQFRQTHYGYYFPFKEGYFYTWTETPYTTTEISLLERFKAIIALTFRRYLDLQKAEAQTREAQIELGLERVRARAMAMQKSDELKDLVKTVSIELSKLDIELDRCFIVIYDVKTFGATWWMSNPETPSEPLGLFVKYHEYPPYLAHLKAWQERKIKWQYLLEGDTKKNWDKFLFVETELSMLPDFVIADMRGNEKVYLSSSFNNFGYLSLATLQPLSEEQFDILLRFAKVFDLTYTRFNDLQKAEAQAREAEIELGLERVRARAMAMQKSDELSDLVDTVFKELTKLDFALNWCIINIIDEPSLTNMVWAANPETNKPPESYLMKFEDYPFHHSMLKGYQERKTKHVYVIEGKEKTTYDNYLFNETEWRRVPKAAQDASRAMKRYVATFSFSNFGGLQTVGEEYLSEENLDILSRFGKVFDLTYTRFNDLKLAEAQAREAKIETALERVRSRTMGMQKSEELKEVIRVVYDQFVHLNIHIEHTGFIMDYKEREDMHIWLADKHAVPFQVTIPYFDCAHWNSFNEAKEKGIDFFANQLSFEEKNKFYKDLFKLIPGVPEETLEYYFRCPGLAISTVLLENVGLYIENFSGTSYSDEENNTLMRLGKVFQQTYTRFLDLQKAETQAREAHIELSLERIRARTMAMHKSEELVDTSIILFQELKTLGVKAIRTGVAIIDDAKQTMELWSSQLIEQKQNKVLGVVHMDLHPFFEGLLHAWRQKNPGFFYEMQGDEVKQYYKVTSSVISYPEQMTYNPREIFNPFFFPEGSLTVVSSQPLSEEERNIMHRFAKVFGLLYRRFLDLQNAEAQAREAQIENALEKVRSRTMAMQRSEELPEAANNLFLQVQALGIPAWSAGYCIWDDDKQGITLWMSSEGVMQPSAHAPCTEDPSFIHMREAYERGDGFHVEEIGGEALVTHYQYMRTLPVVGEILDSIIAAGHPLPTYQIFHCVYFSQGFLLFITYEPVPEAHTIFKRFTNVFEQTYTRFLDLQKAEAQAREAKIEAALERTRTQSMLMQHSDELNNISKVFHQQLLDLHIETEFSYLWLPDEPNGKHLFWATWAEDENDEIIYFSKAINYDLDKTEPATATCFSDWESGVPVHVYTLGPAEVITYFETWKELLSGAKKLKPEFFPEGIYYAEAFMKYGCFGIMIHRKITGEEQEILRRFTVEFERTYTRFLDLQKAEAQAKESQIQLALERVRARTMAMQHSDELKDAAALLFQQAKALGIPAYSCGYNIWEKNEKTFTSWMSSQDGSHFNAVLNIPLTEDANFIRFAASRQKGEQFFVLDLRGERMQEHYEYLKTIPAFKAYFDYAISVGFDLPETQIHHLANFSHGNLLFITLEPCPEFHDVFKRFAAVFEQTYTRFLDLQKAEAQAREAQIELGLERVRARAMSMQKSDELKELIGTVFTELTKLDLVLTRCVIMIFDPKTNGSTWWMANSEDASNPIGLYVKYHEQPPYLAYIKAWQERKIKWQYVLEGKIKNEWDNYIFSESELSQLPDFVIVGMRAPERVYLNVSFNNFGNLTLASLEPLSNEHFDILLRFAKVFDLTYTRFNDLKQAEHLAKQAQLDLENLIAAKKKTEDAMAELKATQTQLIQSEKMASLGELTAGIAHEIQNPLNFVNNFSEVSNELLDEMMEEVAKGNYDEVKAIADDVKQNLEKINHHGKRADGIVKGMLQHSRSSSATKEPTDINKLADEYLRLAYHGLRAKDKSFNATMKTDFDETIGKINVVPQDIGRVILNLITNAFYVVAEKKKQNIEGYEPTVSVSTKKIGDRVEVNVKDNGNGIPQKILDKVFQPFFTTKPTGQGTGLGLSLSYDIVKAHGGEIKVNTKENEGTEFTIILSA